MQATETPRVTNAQHLSKIRKSLVIHHGFLTALYHEKRSVELLLTCFCLKLAIDGIFKLSKQDLNQ